MDFLTKKSQYIYFVSSFYFFLFNDYVQFQDEKTVAHIPTQSGFEDIYLVIKPTNLSVKLNTSPHENGREKEV
jgi:hypothetical protein